MAITDPTTTTILVFCMAFMVLLQTLGLIVVLALLSSRIEAAEKSMVGLVGVIRHELRETSGLLGKAGWLHGKMPAVERQSLRLLDAASSKLTTADEFAGDRLRRATLKIDEAGRKLEYGLTQFTRQTTLLTRELRRPTGHLSAVVKGVLVGFKALRTRERSAPLQDEDIFI
jgi:hypothetical protein